MAFDVLRGGGGAPCGACNNSTSANLPLACVGVVHRALSLSPSLPPSLRRRARAADTDRGGGRRAEEGLIHRLIPIAYSSSSSSSSSSPPPTTESQSHPPLAHPRPLRHPLSLSLPPFLYSLSSPPFAVLVVDENGCAARMRVADKEERARAPLLICAESTWGPEGNFLVSKLRCFKNIVSFYKTGPIGRPRQAAMNELPPMNELPSKNLAPLQKYSALRI